MKKITQKMFLTAAEQGEIAIVEQYIAQYSANPKKLQAALDVASEWGGRTALMNAAFNGHLSIVNLLINEGADLELTEADDGETALFLAVRNGHIGIVELLIKAKSEINIENHDSFTPLMAAADRGFIDIVDLLIQNGAELNNVDLDGKTALIWAASESHLEVVASLIQAGAKINLVERNADTCLDENERGGNALICAVREANYDEKGQYKVSRSHYNVIRYLLACNIDDTNTADNNETALDIVKRKQNYLLENLLTNTNARRLNVLYFEYSRGGRLNKLSAEFNDALTGQPILLPVRFKNKIYDLSSFYFLSSTINPTDFSILHSYQLQLIDDLSAAIRKLGSTFDCQSTADYHSSSLSHFYSPQNITQASKGNDNAGKDINNPKRYP